MAEEVVAEKQKLQSALEEELETLVDKLDEFLEIRLSEELTELAEDIQSVKNSKLGQEMFEAYAEIFIRSHLSKTGVMKKLEEAEKQVELLSTKLEESTMVVADLIRESKMTNLLSNLSGSKREQMEILLKGVATERLEETYKQFVGRIMKDGPQVQISESSQQTTVKTGDAVVITESQSKSAVDDDFRKELQRLAGITK
jgi:predicted RNase H-like nuclease (RuvC/YqgF family)